MFTKGSNSPPQIDIPQPVARSRRKSPPPPNPPKTIAEVQARLRALESAAGLEPVYREPKRPAPRGFRSYEDAFDAGMFLLAIGKDKKALRHCRDRNLMVASVGTAGGFLMPAGLATAVQRHIQEQSVIMQEATVFTMSDNLLTVPLRSSGLTIYPVDENQEITASDIEYDAAELNLRKAAALYKSSVELATDAVVDLVAEFTTEVSGAFAQHFDLVGFVGDGGQDHNSIVGVGTRFANDSTLAGTITAAGSAYTDVTVANIDSMIAALPAHLHGNAKFYASPQGCANIFCRLSDTASLHPVGPMAWCGYPIEFTAALGAGGSGTPLLLLGDLRRAVVFGIKNDIRIMASEQRFMELHSVAYRAVSRFDCIAHGVGDSTDAGAVVSLVGA